MTADLAMMPAHELVKLFKSRKASPVEATKAALADLPCPVGRIRNRPGSGAIAAGPEPTGA